MKSAFRRSHVTLAALCGLTVALAASGIPSASAEEAPSLPGGSIPLSISSKAPKGAIVLYSGKADELQNNWYERYTTKPAGWTVGPDGAANNNRHDITSKQEFGDCYLHVEFHEPVDAQGNPVGGGNSGVGLQGRYEVQIFNSYEQKPEEHGSGALYSQKAPLVSASLKPSEWQSFDIIFRAPRFDDSGKVVENPRATVFENGILVQNNEAFDGMTGIQYGQYHDMTKTGPIVLQGDHDKVQFRNVWIIPLLQNPS
jgi:hypothetical protein